MHSLFNSSNNILGILTRGTDYLSLKPKGHPIPPKPSIILKDVKQFNNKNNCDYFFISTEDDNIREIFIKEFGNKLKFLIYKKVKYNYKTKKKLSYYKNIKDIQYTKIYLLNMIILSKCMDIICARTSGSIGVFIFKKDFRYSKVYNIGIY